MSAYPDKIIVLDIDGCITSIEDNTYFNPDPAKYHPSEKIVKRLKDFCIKNSVKVLISSNWRKFDVDGSWTNSYGTYHNPLPEVKRLLNEVYFDTLASTRHVNKSVALMNWLSANPDFKGRFVIFDDDKREKFQDTDEFGIKDRFIFVDSTVGITDSNLLAAKEILHCE